MKPAKRDWKLVQRIKLRHMVKEALPVERKFEIFEEMVEEAREIGAFPPDDPHGGLDHILRCAWVINYGQKTVSEDSPKAR